MTQDSDGFIAKAAIAIKRAESEGNVLTRVAVREEGDAFARSVGVQVSGRVRFSKNAFGKRIPAPMMQETSCN